MLGPYTFTLYQKISKVKEERRYIIRPCYNKAMIYAKEVENHLSKLSLGNDVKDYWKHLKDVILEVGYQSFQMCVGEHKRSSFPCNSWFDEEHKIYLKLYKFVKMRSEWGMCVGSNGPGFGSNRTEPLNRGLTVYRFKDK